MIKSLENNISYSSLVKSVTLFLLLLLIIGWLALYIWRFLYDHNSSITSPPPASNLEKFPQREVYIGFWTFGFWDDQTKSLNISKLKETEAKIGKKVAIAHYFRGWHHLDEVSFKDDLNKISASDWRPMVSVNPYYFENCKAPKGVTLYKAIWLGHCDDFLKRAAINLKQVEHPFFFRFAWEMNVDSMEWSIQKTGSYESEYIKAWQRMHNIFKEAGVKNAIWVFSPQIETPTTIDITKLYPGDEYVDWVALDGYNWGETRVWSNWQSFKDIFYSSYTKLQKLAPSKKIMIAEVNTVDKGGDRGEWYKKMLTEEILNDFPNINAIVFFNEDKTKQEGINWLIDSSPHALKSLKEGISLPIYKSDF